MNRASLPNPSYQAPIMLNGEPLPKPAPAPRNRGMSDNLVTRMSLILTENDQDREIDTKSIDHVNADDLNQQIDFVPSEINRSDDQLLTIDPDMGQRGSRVSFMEDQNSAPTVRIKDKSDSALQRLRNSYVNERKKRRSIKSFTFHPNQGIAARAFQMANSFADFRNAVYNWLGLHKHVDFCVRIQQRVLTRGEWLVMLVLFGVTIGLTVSSIVLKNPIIPRQASSAGFLLTIYLAVHNSLLDLLLGIPFERRLFWHKLMSMLSLWLGTVHGVLAILKWPGCVSPDLARLMDRPSPAPTGSPDFVPVDPFTRGRHTTVSTTTTLAPSETFSCPDTCFNYDFTFKVLKSCVPYRHLMMISGLVLTGLFFLLLATSIPSALRRKKFGIFHILHLTLTFGITLAAIAHNSYFVIAGVGLLLIDMFIRYVYQACRKHPKIAAVTALPGNITRIMFDRPDDFYYSPGQYLFVNVPKISVLEWHPFTISSSPHTKMITVHIQVLGDWSRRLREFAEDHNSSLDLDIATIEHNFDADRPVSVLNHQNATVPVLIEGPCGESKIDFNAYKVYVLVSGNIGVTPMQALANFLLHQAQKNTRQIVKVYFIWCVSDPDLVNALFESDRRLKAGPLNKLALSEDETVDYLHSEIYLTRAKSMDDRSVQEAEIPPGLVRSIKFGRPDWPAIFSGIESTAERAKEKNVAVYACGNSNLVEQINDFCDYRNKFHRRSAKMSKRPHKLRFDVNLEEFEW